MFKVGDKVTITVPKVVKVKGKDTDMSKEPAEVVSVVPEFSKAVVTFEGRSTLFRLVIPYSELVAR